jgi:hypothetical protein
MIARRRGALPVLVARGLLAREFRDRDQDLPDRFR